MEPGNEQSRVAVKEPRPIRGSPLPLFDRLSQRTAELSTARNAGRILDAPALRESVRQDLSRLLNTRSSLRGSPLQMAEGTVLDYGLPDFSSLSAVSETDRDLLGKVVAARIAAHEPRLRNITVSFVRDAADPRAVQGVIAAVLALEDVYEPVTFSMSMELGSKSPSAALT